MAIVILRLVALVCQLTLGDVAGSWVTKTMIGPRDSIIVTTVIHATADVNGWTYQLPGRNPIQLRVVVVGGDSVVTEAGPYPSTSRPGQSVTLLRNVSHFKGNTMTGTFEAHYSGGHVTVGTLLATRQK
jgi:hypothetical protein